MQFNVAFPELAPFYRHVKEFTNPRSDPGYDNCGQKDQEILEFTLGLGGDVATHGDEEGCILQRPLVDLLGDAVGFLADPDIENDLECEILFSDQIAGFDDPFDHLSRSLSEILAVAAQESEKEGTLILTCTIAEERRVHFSVVSPTGSFRGIVPSDIAGRLNRETDDGEDVKSTPNTPFWRGGEADDEAHLVMEPLPYGGTRATLVIPEAKVAWRD